MKIAIELADRDANMFVRIEQLRALIGQQLEKLDQLGKSIIYHRLREKAEDQDMAKPDEKGRVYISWDPPKIKTLRREYKRAVKAGETEFVLVLGSERHTLLVAYAKYLIQYLVPHFHPMDIGGKLTARES